MRHFVLFFLILWAGPAPAVEPEVEVFCGAAFSFHTPLEVTRPGLPDIRLTARYETKPFKLPLYYSLRAGVRVGVGAVELQYTHHKLYLENPAGDIEHLEITHGYNIFTINGAVRVEDVDLRIGAGPVFAHAESVIGGEAFATTSAWRLAGPALLIGVGRNVSLAEGFYLAPEVQLVAAWASVPLEGPSGGTASRGEIDAPNVAFHIHVGLGYSPPDASSGR